MIREAGIHADRYTLEEWLGELRMGCFNEFDGSAYWATIEGGEMVYDDCASGFGPVPEWATHAVFFGK